MTQSQRGNHLGGVDGFVRLVFPTASVILRLFSSLPASRRRRRHARRRRRDDSSRAAAAAPAVTAFPFSYFSVDREAPRGNVAAVSRGWYE